MIGSKRGLRGALELDRFYFRRGKMYTPRSNSTGVYTGERLRRLRAERGVGRPPRAVA